MPSSLVSKKRRLQGHVQRGGVFVKSDLRSGQAFQSVWEGVRFSDALLSLVDFRGSKWVSCDFAKASVYGANFGAATLHGVTFTGCDMEQVSFPGADLRNVVFRDCRLAYSSFAGATLDGVAFERCNLHGADLDVAEAHDVRYLGSNLWSAKSAFGCAFWNATFDVESCQRFAALLGRVYPDPAAQEVLRQLAGDTTYRAVCRLMDTPSDSGTPDF